jgi:hypothetical protein
MPSIGVYTNPEGFVIAEQEEGQLLVAQIFDIALPEAALINWSPRLSTSMGITSYCQLNTS